MKAGIRNGSVEPYSLATISSAHSRTEALAMLRWSLRLIIGLAVIALTVVGSGPWLLYAAGLTEIDGRPSHASDATVALADVEVLRRALRISQPITIDRLSPHSYMWAIVRGDVRALGQGARVAWLIARQHNADHLASRQAWHLSGAALTIWLTRNWTTNELVAKAIELEKATAAARKALAR